MEDLADNIDFNEMELEGTDSVSDGDKAGEDLFKIGSDGFYQKKGSKAKLQEWAQSQGYSSAEIRGIGMGYSSEWRINGGM